MQMLMELLRMLESSSQNGNNFEDVAKPKAAGSDNSTPPPTDKAAAETSGPYKPTSSQNVDASNPPEGMPQDKWELCVNSAEKTGADPFILAAQMERESKYGNPEVLKNSPSGGDGLMQVEASTRGPERVAEFSEKFGKPYDYNNEQDQVDMAAMILTSKEGDQGEQLRRYNGGDGYASVPGGTDSFNRTTYPYEYAEGVMAMAEKLRASMGG